MHSIKEKNLPKMAGFLKRIHKIFRPERKKKPYDIGWLRDHMPHQESEFNGNFKFNIAKPRSNILERSLSHSQPLEGETIDEYILRTATYVDIWSPENHIIPLKDKSPIEFIRLKPFKFF